MVAELIQQGSLCGYILWPHKVSTRALRYTLAIPWGMYCRIWSGRPLGGLASTLLPISRAPGLASKAMRGRPVPRRLAIRRPRMCCPRRRAWMGVDVGMPLIMLPGVRGRIAEPRSGVLGRGLGRSRVYWDRQL